MLIFKTVPRLQNHLNKLKGERNMIGFTPTMGALHDGHLSLIKKSLHENDFSVVSIFINPTQFNNLEDLQRYPYDIKNDIKLLETLNAEIILFIPNSYEIYSGNIKSEYFEFGKLDKYMEGKFRANHFKGVATVVNKLFSIVKADKSYFGEKDFQQLRIIENLVIAKKIQTKIVRCKTVRNDNGLALSSRNSKLNYSSKKIATNLYKALNFVKINFEILEIINLKKKVIKILSKFPEIKLDYIIIADEEFLVPCSLKKKNIKYRAFIAAYVSGVRLIDNIKLY